MQFLDALDELRDGGGDVGQFDDVALGGLGEFSEVRQLVGDSLVRLKVVAEVGDEATGDGNVALLNLDAHRLGEPLDHRKQRVGL